MDMSSIDRAVRHIKDVPRIEAEFVDLTPEEIERRVEERQAIASVRWTQCHLSFQMLFMAMSRGNKMPLDRFELRLSSEQIGDDIVDTCVRVWRDRKNDTFNTKPFTRNGRIEDHNFTTEVFGDTYNYRFGTYFSKAATLKMNRDDPEATIYLARVDGYPVETMSLRDKAIFLGALEGLVIPSLHETEHTLALLTQAAMDPDLNPKSAQRFRIEH